MDPLTLFSHTSNLMETKGLLVLWLLPKTGRTIPEWFIGKCGADPAVLDVFVARIKDGWSVKRLETVDYTPGLPDNIQPHLFSTHECALCRRPHGLGPYSKYNRS